MMSTHHQSMFNIDNRTLLMMVLVIFWTGALTLVALALGAFIAVVYLINLVLDAITELVTHLFSLYSHTDSLGKSLLWVITLYLVARLAPWVVRSLRRSYKALRW